MVSFSLLVFLCQKDFFSFALRFAGFIKVGFELPNYLLFHYFYFEFGFYFFLVKYSFLYPVASPFQFMELLFIFLVSH